MIATAQAGETVDEICWRVLGRTNSVTEQTLAMNPSIAAHGPKLPAGTQLRLPDVTQTTAPKRAAVQLWD